MSAFDLIDAKLKLQAPSTMPSTVIVDAFKQAMETAAKLGEQFPPIAPPKKQGRPKGSKNKPKG